MEQDVKKDIIKSFEELIKSEVKKEEEAAEEDQEERSSRSEMDTATKWTSSTIKPQENFFPQRLEQVFVQVSCDTLKNILFASEAFTGKRQCNFSFSLIFNRRLIFHSSFCSFFSFFLSFFSTLIVFPLSLFGLDLALVPELII